VFHAAGTDAHRIASGEVGWIERYGEDALISYQEPRAREELLEHLPMWEADCGLPLRRVFGRFVPRQNDERIAPGLLRGDAALPLNITARENGLVYGIDFSAGYSVGLFVDQRANREFLRRAAPRRVLNTFAYTCAFSVAAARAGAETMSVDLSRKSLDRGRDNFALNGLDAAAHKFIADDVREVLPRLARRRELFDAIILDPPTFSRGNNGRRFQVESDFEELLAAVLELAAPRAKILLSTNCTRLSQRELERIANHALKLTRKSADFYRVLALPDIPPEFAARTLWLRMK